MKTIKKDNTNNKVIKSTKKVEKRNSAIKISNQFVKFVKNLGLEKNKFNSIELFIMFIMALVFGLLIGEVVFSGYSVSLTKNKAADLREIEEVYNSIISESIKDIDKEQVKTGAINGMLSAIGDNYSAYYDSDNSADFKETLTGSFYGMGAQIYRDDDGNIVVHSVFDNSPAKKAGLRAGDIYLKLNEKDVTKMSTEEVANLIKGKSSETFNLLVKRGNKKIELKITTDLVEIPSVTSKIYNMNDKKIGYISIDSFANNTDEQFEKEFTKIKNLSDIIIDVRDNSGGSLDTVVNIASMFASKEDVIVQTGKDKNLKKIFSNKEGNKNYNIVVLMNENSASGSEVLAASLKENANATLVGVKTFGKGSVQKTKALSDGTMVKYTTEMWYTGKGSAIDGKGIKPDVNIKINEKYYKTLNEDDDNQLQKAIAILINK